MAKKQIEEVTTEEVVTLSPQEIAAKYFAENPEYVHPSVLVSEDGIVFPDTLKGINSATNYGKPFVSVDKF